MPYNGVGVFTRVYQWVQDAANGIFVDATRTDTDSNDIASGLTNCVTRDGQSPWLNNIPAGGFKITNLGIGAQPTDSVNYQQVFTNPTFSGTATFVNITGTGVINFGSSTSVTVPTVAAGDNSNNAASTAFATALSFQAALPGITAPVTDFFVTNNGSVASWSNLLKAATIRVADSTDTSKRLQFVLSGISTGQTRTATMPDRNVLLGANMVLDSRTTNTQLVAVDAGKLVRITGAGGFTQTFDTFANLGANWWIRIWNTSTGNITIPSSDGLTNWIMYPGEARDFQCDGTQLISLVLKPYRTRFLASGTWTKPPGYLKHRGVVASGGCSGSKSSGGTFAAAGPGGGAFPFEIADSVLGATETVTVGAGGVAQTVASTDGNSGGTSSFGNWVSVIGGIAAPGAGGPIG